MGSLKVGVFCQVNGGEPGWYFMHFKGKWYFFPDKNCGEKREVKEELGTAKDKMTMWHAFTAQDKKITNILALVDLSDHLVLINKGVF